MANELDVEALAREWLAQAAWVASGGKGDQPAIPLVSALPGPDGVGEHFARALLAQAERIRQLESALEAACNEFDELGSPAASQLRAKMRLES